MALSIPQRVIEPGQRSKPSLEVFQQLRLFAVWRASFAPVFKMYSAWLWASVPRVAAVSRVSSLPGLANQRSRAFCWASGAVSLRICVTE